MLHLSHRQGVVIFRWAVDEIYELFQSGWSGAPYEESEDGADVSVSMLTRTGKEALAASRLRRLRKEVNKRDTQEKTQLSAIVEYLKLKAEELGYKMQGSFGCRF